MLGKAKQVRTATTAHLVGMATANLPTIDNGAPNLCQVPSLPFLLVMDSIFYYTEHPALPDSLSIVVVVVVAGVFPFSTHCT